MGNSWTVNQKDCNIPCPGDAAQICGGASVFNIFEAKTKDTPPPPPSTSTATGSIITSSPATSTPTWTPLGCYRDLYPSTSCTLTTFGGYGSTMTPALCQSTCAARGFLLAGDSEQRCGAEARIYLYRYVVPPVPWVPLGCYGEEQERVLRNLLAVPGGEGNNTR